MVDALLAVDDAPCQSIATPETKGHNTHAGVGEGEAEGERVLLGGRVVTVLVSDERGQALSTEVDCKHM